MNELLYDGGRWCVVMLGCSLFIAVFIMLIVCLVWATATECGYNNDGECEINLLKATHNSVSTNLSRTPLFIIYISSQMQPLLLLVAPQSMGAEM